MTQEDQRDTQRARVVSHAIGDAHLSIVTPTLVCVVERGMGISSVDLDSFVHHGGHAAELASLLARSGFGRSPSFAIAEFHASDSLLVLLRSAGRAVARTLSGPIELSGTSYSTLLEQRVPFAIDVDIWIERESSHGQRGEDGGDATSPAVGAASSISCWRQTAENASGKTLITSPDDVAETLCELAPDVGTGRRLSEPDTRRADHTAEAPLLLAAVSCSSGHLSPPYVSVCRSCREPLADRPATQVRQPVLGHLWLVDGRTVPILGKIVIGRAPGVQAPHRTALQVDDPLDRISRHHVEVRAEAWSIVVEDLGSVNGTIVERPGQKAQALHPHQPIVVESRTHIVLGNAERVIVAP